jgi:hypothetical protein
MKSRILGLLAFGLIGVSASAASMGSDASDPNSAVNYMFWSPTLTGTLDGQPFQGQLIYEFTFFNGIPSENSFVIDGVQGGIGGLHPVSLTEWCSLDSCITKVPGGLDVQSSRSLDDGFLLILARHYLNRYQHLV